VLIGNLPHPSSFSPPLAPEYLSPACDFRPKTGSFQFERATPPDGPCFDFPSGPFPPLKNHLFCDLRLGVYFCPIRSVSISFSFSSSLGEIFSPLHPLLSMYGGQLFRGLNPFSVQCIPNCEFFSLTFFRTSSPFFFSFFLREHAGPTFAAHQFCNYLSFFPLRCVFFLYGPSSSLSLPLDFLSLLLVDGLMRGPLSHG